MNVAQQILVDKTLLVLGWLTLIAGGGPLILGVFTVRRFWRDLVDMREPSVLLIPLFLCGIACLWTRAYIRAGRSNL